MCHADPRPMAKTTVDEITRCFVAARGSLRVPCEAVGVAF